MKQVINTESRPIKMWLNDIEDGALAQAKNLANLPFIHKLDEMGIIHAVRNNADLEEAPSAYKDIDIVMENQKDLVKVLVELTPLAVIKG